MGKPPFVVYENIAKWKNSEKILRYAEIYPRYISAFKIIIQSLFFESHTFSWTNKLG